MPRRKKPKPLPPDCDWTPIDAINWLCTMANKQKFGTNYFAECLAVLRYLVRERALVKIELDRRDAEIARLQKLKTPVPFDVGGQGSWG